MTINNCSMQLPIIQSKGPINHAGFLVMLRRKFFSSPNNRSLLRPANIFATVLLTITQVTGVTGVYAAPIEAKTLSITSTFISSADAYVDASAADTNYGNSAELRISNSPIVRSYLRFDVQGLSGTVAKATLRIYATNDSTAGYSVNLNSDTSWDETSINFTNAPSVGTQVGSVGAFGTGVWTTVDVTPFITGNGPVSLTLSGMSDTAVSFVSREGGENTPQLEITANEVSANTPTVEPSATPVPTQKYTATSGLIPPSPTATAALVTNLPSPMAMPPTPSTLALVSPSGTLTSWDKSLRWTGTTDATFYWVEVYNSSDSRILNISYSTSSCTGLNCAASPAALATLANGSYKWRMRIWSNASSSYDPWTGYTNFTLNLPTPSTLALVSPSGTLTSWDKSLRWTGTTDATFYWVEVYNSSDSRILNISYSTTPCTGLNCAASPAALATLANGSYKWRMRIWSNASSSYGPWTAYMSFTLNNPLAATSTPIPPTVTPTVPVSTNGKFWYVDNAVSTSGDGTSWAKAWKGFSHIQWSLVQPGDTVYLSGGSSGKTYNEQLSVSKSGTSSARITITGGVDAGHTGQVIIDGGETRSYCALTKGNYLTLSGLTCQHSIRSGIRIEGTGTILEKSVFNSISGQAIHLAGCDECIVRGNQITTDDSNSAQTDGIVIYGNSTKAVIESNWIKLTNQIGGHNDGIQANKDTDLTVRYNYIENTKNSTSDAQGIYATQMYGTVKYYGNIVVLPYGGQAVSNLNLDIGTSHSVIINNVIKCGGYRCLYIDGDTSPLVKNNIVWQTGKSDVLLLSDKYSRGVSLANISDSNIDGNLWYAPGGDGKVFDAFGQKNWSSWQSEGFDTHGKNTDPRLDSCFRPSNGSPAINAGQVVMNEYGFGLSMSLCGTNRSTELLPVILTDRGTAWNIGAFDNK